MTKFNPSRDSKDNSWVYERLNTFHVRNRKFKDYTHEYFYACLDVLNS
jgi:hypothetical protein